jgi:regulator of cell morphogenesis and NO signaling
MNGLMEHAETIISSSVTPLFERTVGELVAERPGRSRIFQALGIDFCCRGKQILREACAFKGVPLEDVLSKLTLEFQGSHKGAPNPAKLSTENLIAHIILHHHDFLRKELPRLHAMAEKVAQVHGEANHRLWEVYEVFCALEAELLPHLLEEEEILFPAVLRAEREKSGEISLDGPIDCLEHEHEEAGEQLRELRTLTNNFCPPADACNTYRALFAGLEELEKDLHLHIHLENSVLFPRAEGFCHQESY